MLYCNAEINCILCNWIQPSVLWRCWLGGRKSIRPVKNREWWGAGVVICLEWGADLHMAQLMPLPLVVCCFSKIQTGFNLLVPAHLGSPGKGPLNGCVCVCVCVWIQSSLNSGLPISLARSDRNHSLTCYPWQCVSKNVKKQQCQLYG